MRMALRLLVCLLPFALALASAEDFAPSVPIPDALRADVMCGMALIALEGGVPTAEEVGLPAYPDAVFNGRFPPLQVTANGVTTTTLPNVFLLTAAPVDDVATFYAERLDASWSREDVFGMVFFYQHEPVDDILALLAENFGTLPVVEIADIIDPDCDRLILPEARTYVRVYYPPN